MIEKKDPNTPELPGQDRFVLNKPESDSDATGTILEPDVEIPKPPVLKPVFPNDPLAPVPVAAPSPTPVSKYVVCPAGCAKCNKGKFCLVDCEEGFRTVKKSRGNKCFPCNNKKCDKPTTGKDYTLKLFVADTKDAGTNSKIIVRFKIFGKWTVWW